MTSLQDISENILRYGDMRGVPVWLAVETRPLPLERHVMLQRATRKDLADAYLDPVRRTVVLAPPPPHQQGHWFRIHHRITVRPERLSFFQESRQQVLRSVHTVMNTVEHPSVVGMVIHDFDGFLALAEDGPSSGRTGHSHE